VNNVFLINIHVPLVRKQSFFSNRIECKKYIFRESISIFSLSKLFSYSFFPTWILSSATHKSTCWYRLVDENIRLLYVGCLLFRLNHQWISDLEKISPECFSLYILLGSVFFGCIVNEKDILTWIKKNLIRGWNHSNPSVCISIPLKGRSYAKLIQVHLLFI